jgi:hypothetical protein
MEIAVELVDVCVHVPEAESSIDQELDARGRALRPVRRTARICPVRRRWQTRINRIRGVVAFCIASSNSSAVAFAGTSVALETYRRLHF